MSKITVAIHGGARDETEFIRKNLNGYKQALKESAQIAFELLKRGKPALDAVEAAITFMEDNMLFNAGRGSAINSLGYVSMDSSIMDGKDLRCGSVALLQKVKNPVQLARLILEENHHILLAGEGALSYAKYKGVRLEEDAYFILPHQYDMFMERRDKLTQKEQDALKNHGTVGAVALDAKGNLAAASSTGGTSFNRNGRVGDAAMIGVGCYANNNSCAVCATGDGELNIRSIASGYVSVLMEQGNMSIQQACDYVIHQKNKNAKGDMGLIAVDPKGNVGISYNSQLMHRAWISSDQEVIVKIHEK
ncbi:MAG: isoaspartyl peptidase/L-asparaginase [Bacteroidetes bacterium]|nr:isoaspartyl peptidase/L-asparaginase [Bacteroidota bacterium]